MSVEAMKDDGLQLIIEPGYKLSDLQKYIEQSCLAKRCEFALTFEPTKDIVELYKYFIKLLDEELNLDEITTLYVISSMLFFVQATPFNIEWRENLLQKTFFYCDTVKPMHLHLATKRMWFGMKTQGIDFAFNVLTICNEISVGGITARSVAISLIWTIVSEITESEIDIYCFRELSELYEMLNDIDDEMLKMEDTTNIVYILVRCIGFLINSIVFGQNSFFMENGFCVYFQYKKKDLQRLKAWAERFCESLRISVSASNSYWDLRMAIKEYVNANIIGVLNERINEMTSPTDPL